MSQPARLQSLTQNQIAQEERGAMIERQRRFVKWLDKGKQIRMTGRNIAYIRQYHPWPFNFDEYELKRAIEEHLV